MIITTVIFLAITINKISFFPVCENIQTSEDGDGELVILWYFLFKPVKTRRVPHHSHQSLKGSEGARLQKVDHSQSFSMLFNICIILHCVPCWPNNGDMMLMMVQLQLWPRFSDDTYFCFCFPWAGLNMWGVGGYQNKVYTSVARESVRSSYKVWYVPSFDK